MDSLNNNLDDVFAGIHKRQKKLLFIKFSILAVWYIGFMAGLYFI